MSGGGDYGGIVIALGIIFTIGFIIPLVISPFVPEDLSTSNSVAYAFGNFVNDGITIDLPVLPAFHINPFGLLGDGVKSFLIDQIVAFSYIPPIVSAPLLIFAFILLFYSIIKLIP